VSEADDVFVGKMTVMKMPRRRVPPPDTDVGSVGPVTLWTQAMSGHDCGCEFAKRICAAEKCPRRTKNGKLEL
jgi:hypothetical protein